MQRQRMQMPMLKPQMERNRLVGMTIPNIRIVVLEGAAEAVALATAEIIVSTKGTMMAVS